MGGHTDGEGDNDIIKHCCFSSFWKLRVSCLSSDLRKIARKLVSRIPRMWKSEQTLMAVQWLHITYAQQKDTKYVHPTYQSHYYYCIERYCCVGEGWVGGWRGFFFLHCTKCCGGTSSTFKGILGKRRALVPRAPNHQGLHDIILSYLAMWERWVILSHNNLPSMTGVNSEPMIYLFLYAYEITKVGAVAYF